MKDKIDKFGFIKIFSMKISLRKWIYAIYLEKMVTIHTYDKGFTSKIYQEPHKSIKKTNNPITKWKKIKWHFHKRSQNIQ